MQLLSTVIAATKQSRIPTIFILLCHTIFIFYGLKHTRSQLSLVMQDTTISNNIKALFPSKRYARYETQQKT
jgi:hypothetical protein